MRRSSLQLWVRVAFVCIGLFGAAFAVAGYLVPLPTPAAGGTCGPGTSSEAPIVALFDPVTIGAGPEPPATQTANRNQWQAFVHDCQSATNNRMLAATVILVLSVGVAVFGPKLAGRWGRTSKQATVTTPPTWSTELPHLAPSHQGSGWPVWHDPSGRHSPSG